MRFLIFYGLKIVIKCGISKQSEQLSVWCEIELGVSLTVRVEARGKDKNSSLTLGSLNDGSSPYFFTPQRG
jgi:hypothetical protein